MANTTGINLPGSGYSRGVRKLPGQRLPTKRPPVHGKAAPAPKLTVMNGHEVLSRRLPARTATSPGPVHGRATQRAGGIGGQMTAKPIVVGGTIHRSSPVAAPGRPALDAHQQHVAHAAHVAAATKANAARSSTVLAGAKGKSVTKAGTLDAHQLHLLHLGHTGLVSGASSSPISPPDQGGSVSPAQGAPGVAADTSTTGGGLLSGVFGIGVKIAVLLLLIWAWRKGYFKGVTKAAGKAIKGTGSKIGKVV
jgi:hypothetical protein